MWWIVLGLIFLMALSMLTMSICRIASEYDDDMERIFYQEYQKAGGLKSE